MSGFSEAAMGGGLLGSRVYYLINQQLNKKSAYSMHFLTSGRSIYPSQ